MRWDPEQYLQFAAERGRPFQDLMARVTADRPARRRRPRLRAGQPHGHPGRPLAGRRRAGLDSSPEMVEQAQRSTRPAGVVRGGRPAGVARAGPVDVLVSNATLQWVPGHLDLLPGLVEQVRPGGWFAFQVPGNFGERSHTAMAEVATSPRWADTFGGRDSARPAVEGRQTYLELLAGLGCTVDAWETTYLHVLRGDDAVVRWVMGTGLRPYLQVLDDDADREEFLADYRACWRRRTRSTPWGTVLPFRRIFVVARRAEA